MTKFEISTLSLVEFDATCDDWSTIRSGINKTLDSRFVISKLITNLSKKIIKKQCHQLKTEIPVRYSSKSSSSAKNQKKKRIGCNGDD